MTRCCDQKHQRYAKDIRTEFNCTVHNGKSAAAITNRSRYCTVKAN